jgi:hypothetical protein
MAFSRSERLVAPDYLGDVQARPIDEIRAMRAECQEAEVGLSYLRRLVQGRIDIVAADLRRRAEGGAPTDLADLVEHLPEILAEHVHAAGFGRLPTLMAPSEADETELHSELDAVVDAEQLSSLSSLPDDEVHRLVDQLSALERSVSDRRRALHERIDTLQAELTRRYKTGEATVESLLR